MDKELAERFARGDLIIVWDAFREEEGDFMCLAQDITPAKVNLMLTYGKGMITVACGKEIFEQFDMSLMVHQNSSPHNTQMAIGFDAKDKATTGVSAPDRAEAIKLLCDPNASADDMTLPGHTFPLLALDPKDRFGHTEAGVELAKYVKAKPAVVLCEILDEEGEKGDSDYVKGLAQKYDIPIIDLEILRQSI